MSNYLNDLAFEIHENADKHGFYDEYSNTLSALAASNIEASKWEKMDDFIHQTFVLSQLSKISGEVGECGDAIAHGALNTPQLGKLPEELADVLIRTLDLMGFLEINVDDVVKQKMEYNKTRPYLHGKCC